MANAGETGIGGKASQVLSEIIGSQTQPADERQQRRLVLHQIQHPLVVLDQAARLDDDGGGDSDRNGDGGYR